MKYSMFIGRWQPWHKGHRWLINQRLLEDKNVLICIREVSLDDKNPYNPLDVKKNIESELKDLIENGRVKVIIIPDIESINYGRGVGYDIIEHVPPSEIGEISATEIRKNYAQEHTMNKDYNIGIIGKGFVGSAVAHGFSAACGYNANIRIFDKDPSRSSNTLTETVNESDFIFISVPTPANKKERMIYLY